MDAKEDLQENLFKEYLKRENLTRNIIKSKKYTEKALNQSFNLNKINSPDECGFYVADLGNAFSTYQREKNLNDKNLYLEFFKFYNQYLKENIGTNLNTFMARRIELWKTRNNGKEELDITQIDSKFLLGYMFQKFVKNTFFGIEREIKVKNTFESMARYKGIKIQIEETEGREDNKRSVDFYVLTERIKIGIQVKPVSFFKGLKDTTHHAAKKFNQSILSDPNKTPLFIVESEKGRQLNFLIRDKENNNQIRKINLQEFFKLFEGNFNKEKIYQMSKESSVAMINMKEKKTEERPQQNLNI